MQNNMSYYIEPKNRLHKNHILGQARLIGPFPCASSAVMYIEQTLANPEAYQASIYFADRVTLYKGEIFKLDEREQEKLRETHWKKQEEKLRIKMWTYLLSILTILTLLLTLGA